MNLPIQISPEKAFHEFYEFSNKLSAGFKNLAAAEPISSGVTDKEAVYSENKLTLYHYKSPFGDPKNPIPVLIVYALVNRPYMTDIQENRSTVRGMLEAGLDVYLIDWGYPDMGDKFLDLNDYINGYIDRCVNVVSRRSKQKKINILGICQGGTFSLCYAALHPEKVKNLVTMVTPVDFHTEDNMLSRWVQHVNIDLLVDTLGNVPGEMLNLTFLSLKPFRLSSQKYLDMVGLMDKPDQLANFLRMEQWIFDSPDQAGEAYREFIKGFYQDNGLIHDRIMIGGKTVSLKDVSMPVLNIFARDDHLVPPAASKAMRKHVGTKDYSELDFPGGHIGIYVSGRAQKEVPPAIGKWLDKRS